MSPSDRVTERVFKNGNPEARSVATPLLTLEEFFEGNDLSGSIGCNLPAVPEPSDVYQVLKGLRGRPEVLDIRMQISAVDHPGEDWPFSDTIWFVKSADVATVRGWLPSCMAPTDSWTGWVCNVKYDDCHVPDGYAPVAVWYD